MTKRAWRREAAYWRRKAEDTQLEVQRQRHQISELRLDLAIAKCGRRLVEVSQRIRQHHPYVGLGD